MEFQSTGDIVVGFLNQLEGISIYCKRTKYVLGELIIQALEGIKLKTSHKHFFFSCEEVLKAFQELIQG